MKKNQDLSGDIKFPGHKKVLRIMKLTAFLIMISMFGVLANKTYSQSKMLNLNMEKATVREVLSKIEDQSEFHFMYSAEVIDVNRLVSINVQDTKIDEVLKSLFAGTKVDYTIQDRFIVLSLPEDSNATTIQQKSLTVLGKVTDSSNMPLPGVTVVLKGTTKGTITDSDGNYILNNVAGDAILVFSFVGMKAQEIPVNEQTSIDVTLIEEAIGIEEVVAIGYGTMKKSDLTGSVVSANIEAFRESPNVSILQSLQGAVPGVRIGQTNQAGQEAGISVRGTSTLNGSTDPLIILDGIIYNGSITRLNPNDIKSVDVLKDPSSKAIYGARAANGVILITSKSGKANKRPEINYTVSATMQTPTNNARLLNQEEFLKKIKDINYETAYLASDYLEENTDWDYSQSELVLANIEGIENGTDFDWWDALTSPGHLVTHNLSLSGGTKNTSYFVSGGYTDYEGFLMNDDYQRSSVRINIETQVTPWLKAGINTFGTFNDYSGVCPNMSSLAKTSPFVLPKDENGDYVVNHLGDNIINPFLDATADDEDLRNSISGNFYGIVSIPWIKGLSYRINYSNNLRWQSHYYSNKYDESQTGSAYKVNASTNDMLLDNIVTYNKKINEVHSLEFTIVYGCTQTDYEKTTALGTNFSNLDLSYNSLQQATVQNISSSAWKESSLYQMGRMNYNYKNRYLLTATIRRDGFSGFSKNNKFGIFPSVGLGWVLSDENFYNIPSLEYFKLRGSYGENGNLTTRYSSLAVVESDGYSQYVFGDGASTSNGQEPTSLANNELSWETTTGFNFGIDFAAFNNRLRGNIEYYRTTTTDLLWDMTLPEMTGFSDITTNLGKIANTGFELAVFTTPVKASNFTWNLDLNISTNKNEIKELIGIDEDGDGVEDDLVSSGLFIGESIGAIYTYEIDGMWQLDDDIMTGFFPGTYRIVDQDGDGIISAAKDRKILGHTEPVYQFGIQNTLKYKNFTLRFFINSIQGGKNGYMKANNPSGYSTGLAQNYNWFNFYDYWSPSNPNAKYKNSWLSPSISASRYQSRSFVRLQDISLAYKLEASLLNKLGIGDAKIYISGKNLLTFTKWDGWDPETGQGISNGSAYPVMKSYTLGLDLTF
ncbi:TonB-dependent receptor [Sunxiuqinia indica]|uniref:TonB-dependent receptor n=1 Tax=Sunxiuqinia indica TaxID=2692584 RepID=UPI001915D4DA|nr:TonB-dependent receptor [Sunxiuqinia indica]